MKAPHFPLEQQQPGSGRTIKFIKDRGNVCLSSDQARYIYKKSRKGYFS